VIRIFLLLAFAVIASSAEIDVPMGGGWQNIELSPPDSTEIEFHIPWLITESLLVTQNADTMVVGLDYFWSDSESILTLPPSPKWVLDVNIHLKFQTAQIMKEQEFSVFSPVEISNSTEDKTDRYIFSRTSESGKPSTLFGNWGNIHHRGVLSRGIRIDQNSTGVTSGMHLELSGRPVSGVTVDALLDDRDIPGSSTGGSATLSELDRILFRIRTPHLEAELGDWDLNWKSGQFVRLKRQLKGGKISGKLKSSFAELAAAGGNNTYQTNAFNGRDGDQGPYELTDKYGRSPILVASGSERIYLNGKLLTKGRNRDYMFDYQFGKITFTPGVIIDSNSRIEAEFEYNDGSYPHYLYAGRIGSGNNRYSIETSTVIEGLDENNPLAFEWNDTWRRSIRNAGDNRFGAIVSGVETVEPGTGDYIYGLTGEDSILVFSYPDSTGKPTGDLRVYFSLDSSGGYERIFDDILLTYYYKWVGAGTGNWSPVRHLPLPDRLVHSDVYSRLNFGRFSIKSEIAVSDFDGNVLSSQDDDDNLGIAWSFSGNYGDASLDKLATSLSARKTGQNYKSTAKEKDPDYYYEWNIGDSLSGSETAVEAEVNARPSDHFSITGNAGLLEKGDYLSSQRTGFNGNWIITKNARVNTEYNRTKTENNLSGTNVKRSIYSGHFQTLKGILQPAYSLRFEKSLVNGGDAERGEEVLYFHDLSVKSKPSVNDEVNVKFSYRAVDNKLNNIENIGSDSRIIQGGWKRNIRQIGGIEVDILRSLTTTNNPEQEAITATTAILNGIYRPRESSWMAQFDYSLTTGNERTGTRIATYIGEGRGGWKLEGDRYVPDPDGDFSMREIFTDTLGRVSRAEINGRIQWNAKQKQTKNEELTKYPLGISGSTLRLTLNLVTTETDPYKAFYFDPVSFKSDLMIYSQRRIIHDLDFLKNNPVGDGRLSMRWNEIQDQAISGGEWNNTISASFRARRRLHKTLRLKIEPRWERSLRQGLDFDDIRSEVIIGRGELALESRSPNSRIESELSYGYEERKDPNQDISVIERDWKSGITWKLSQSGSVRADIQWLNLTSNRKSPGYDLDRGWEIGNNFLTSVYTDYRLRDNLRLTANYRGRWRGQRAPRHEGMVEMTVTL